jgi:cytochrome P450
MGSLLGQQMLSSEITNHKSGAKPLQPIKLGLLESWRLISLSYSDPLQHARHLNDTYGDVVMQKVGSMNVVHLFGVDASKLSLLNADNILSNKKAWDQIIGRLFPNGLMLRDAEDHRYHRRIMQVAFKSQAMQGYFFEMAPQIDSVLRRWPQQGELHAYPAFKDMTLDLAATVFLGMELGADATRINTAFEQTVAASMWRFPFAFPGTQLWRGVRARKTMCEFFRPLISQRKIGDRQDLFSILCRATDEDGNGYSDEEIIDHINFLMMAAHDTTTSALTSMTYALAKNPRWQERLWQEMQHMQGRALEPQDLATMTETSWVMKEALRLYPPLSTLPKYSNTSFDFNGYQIPTDAMVITYPIHTHHSPLYWDDPQRFDPERFSDERKEHKRHPYSWVPFSGGAHMCIGLHFAEMQIKLVMYHMLQRYRWSVPDDYEMPVQQSPISKPRDGLPVQLRLRSDG